MLTSCFFETIDQHFIARFEIKDRVINAHFLELFQLRVNRLDKLAAAHVDDQADLVDVVFRLHHQLCQTRDQRRRQIVDAEIAHVFKIIAGRAFACA